MIIKGKTKILVVTTGHNACSYYRAEMMAKYLDKDRYEIVNSRGLPDGDLNCDVLYVSGFYVYHILLNNFMEGCKKYYPKMRIILETDDLVHEIPENSPAFLLFNPKMPSMQDLSYFRWCDLLVVSTQELAEYYRDERKIGCPVKVIENALDKDDWQKALPDPRFILNWESRHHFTREPRPLRIGWQGSHLHRGCLNSARSFFEKIKNNKKYVFVYFGGEDTIKGSEIFNDFNNLEYHGDVPLDYYAQAYARLNLDIALAPLEDTLFNRAKSGIKVLEAIACGYMPLASDVASYHRLLAARCPELLIGENDSWFDKMQALTFIEKRSKLFPVLNTILDENLIVKRMEDWNEIFQ